MGNDIHEQFGNAEPEAAARCTDRKFANSREQCTLEASYAGNCRFDSDPKLPEAVSIFSIAAEWRCTSVKPPVNLDSSPAERCTLQGYHAGNCHFDSEPKLPVPSLEDRVAFIERHVGDHAEALMRATKAERAVAELRFEVACARAESLRTKNFVADEIKRMNSRRYKRPSTIGLLHRLLNYLEQRR